MLEFNVWIKGTWSQWMQVVGLCAVAGWAACGVTPESAVAQGNVAQVNVAQGSAAQEKKEKEEKTVVEEPEKLFEPREYVGSNGHTLKYRLLKPSPYNADRK